MSSPFLRNVWYAACLTADIKKNKMLTRVILGEPVLFYRDQKRNVRALRDICPHRGIPLSYGRLVDDQVECPYHGWKFDCEGTCTEIPSLLPDQSFDSTKIKVRTYLTREQQGVVWVFMSDRASRSASEVTALESSSGPQIPILSALPLDAKPQVALNKMFSCHVDHAVIGLMDPAHGPFIHKSWMWRSKKSMFEKTKKFAPVPFGFQMVRHQPSKNSKAYKILGGAPTTEITFTLPSVRVEHICVGLRNLYSMTLLTPVTEKETRIHQLLYWDISWLTLIRPFVTWFARFFLKQDIDAVNQQQDGLKFDPTLMLIRDADTQAKWYFALKDQWIKSQQEGLKFKHPVTEVALRWRS
ncbi:MAG: aromatic ring-hydroxylating dioxygenase subunit alpha [Bdellovibrionaceae bacterium]|nr:aromatic ring-hydroxylating dioxygenase subunit alpha [Pseudobdellovibrionaceae bacterium]